MRLFLTFLICVTANVAYAAEQLSEQAIRDFYQKAVDVQLEGAEPTVAFLEKHIAPKAVATMHMITNIKSVPPKKNTEKFNKTRLINTTRQGYKIMKLKTIESTVLSIKVAEDGRSATVKDSTFSTLIQNIPAPQGVLAFDTEQSMLCDGEVFLEEGVIKAGSSTCNVEVTMEPVR